MHRPTYDNFSQSVQEVVADDAATVQGGTVWQRRLQLVELERGNTQAAVCTLLTRLRRDVVDVSMDAQLTKVNLQRFQNCFSCCCKDVHGLYSFTRVLQRLQASFQLGLLLTSNTSMPLQG